MRIIFFLTLSAFLFMTAPPLAAQEEQALDDMDHLYRVTLLRADAGRFKDLLTNLRNRREDHDLYILRHSQGDHWDFMTLEPLGSYGAWFAEVNADALTDDEIWRGELDDMVAFRSEWFAYGPQPAYLASEVVENGLYHIEMFRALAGKKAKLIEQRRMENRYLHQTGQRANVIFRGDQGGDWDVMTIGFHNDLKSFAAGSDLSPAEKDRIAKEAGFDGVSDIAPYFRRLLVSHNDTLAVSVD